MRIIAGEFRSRRLHTPRDDSTTRPIPDRVKESLFGLLRGHCEGAAVFDGFAGTGAMGLEAVSRGAARCVFVEKDRDAAALLKRNLDDLDVGDRCELVVGDALGPGALSRCPRPVNLVFLDPPYPLVREPTGWRRVRAQLERLIELLTDDGFAVVRTPWPFLHGGDEALPAPAERKRERRPDDRGLLLRPERRVPAAAPKEPEPVETPEPAERVWGDLKIPGAIGPETHVYHSTAIHLYMRDRAAPARGA